MSVVERPSPSVTPLGVALWTSLWAATYLTQASVQSLRGQYLEVTAVVFLVMGLLVGTQGVFR